MPEIHTLFDAGDGVASELNTKLFNLERVVVSHDHLDHTGGLTSLIALRAVAMGDKEKPLEVCWMGKGPVARALKKATETATKFRKFELTWTEIGPGWEAQVARDRRLRAIKAYHGGAPALSFQILERRETLRPDLRGIPGIEIARLRENGEKITLPYDKVLWVYSGDSMPMAPGDVAGADLLIHDCTFLRGEDRREKTHASLDELADLVRHSKPKKAWGIHISPRYGETDYAQAKRRIACARLKGNLNLLPRKTTTLVAGQISRDKPKGKRPQKS